MAPADVRGPDVAPVHRGLAWWQDGTLYTASGRPDSPTVAAYPAPDPPVRVGGGWRIGTTSITSCGCSSPWKRVDTAPLVALAVHAAVDA